MNKPSRRLAALASLSISALLLPENAYAYLDPGTGSYILQLLVGALFGAAFTLKLFFKRISFFLKGLRGRKNG